MMPGADLKLRRAWYLQTKDLVARAVIDVVDVILQQDSERIAGYEKYAKLYGGRRQLVYKPGRHGLAGVPAAVSVPTPELAERLVGSGQSPLRLNVVRAAVDTVTAKVGRMRPRPTFLTDGGNWTLQRRAKNLQRFVDGAYHEADVYEQSKEVFRDAMVLGTGVLLPYSRGGGEGSRIRPGLRAERTPVWEWFVERGDAMYGEPRCLYRERWVARERVRLVWPEHADAGRAKDDADEDYVRVIEAWFRPLDPKDEPEDSSKVVLSQVPYCGRHLLLVDEEIVVDEYYPYTDFPPVFLHWSKPVSGFWGDSAVREVEGLQVEINRLLDVIQRSMKKVGQPWVLTPSEANLQPKELTNEIGLKIAYDGQMKPEVVTFQAVHPQLIQHLWELYNKAFEILGSNQLAASATTPPNVESGRALERLSEEHSERFLTVSRAYEFAIGEQLARRFIRLAKELDATVPGGFKLRAPGTKVSIPLKWKDVEIQQDSYIAVVFPTSALPTQPSARMDEVERMQNNGWVDQEEARRLIDLPDLQQSNSLATADYDALMWQLERMLEDGEPVLPEPFQNLQRAVHVGQLAILRAMQEGAPGKNIDLVRQFVTAATDMLDAAMATPTPASPTGAAPDAMPADAAMQPPNGAPVAPV